MKLAIRIVAVVLIAAVLLVGGSAVYEGIYCAGWSQGAIDGFAIMAGPPPEDWDNAPLVEMCSVNPNDPVSNGAVPRFNTGNLFDSLRNKLPW